MGEAREAREWAMEAHKARGWVGEEREAREWAGEAREARKWAEEVREARESVREVDGWSVVGTELKAGEKGETGRKTEARHGRGPGCPYRQADGLTDFGPPVVGPTPAATSRH